VTDKMRAYRNSPRGKEVTKKARLKYLASAKGKAVRAAYCNTEVFRERMRLKAAKLRATPEGKEKLRLAKARYKLTEKYKATQAEYIRSPRHRALHAIAKAKYTAANRDRINRDRLPTARAYGSSAKGKAVRAKYMASPEGKIKYTKAYLKRTYGMTLEQYTAQVLKQKGVCAICGRVNRAGRRLVVDHDHETGKVRELLCDPCNLVLGYMEDNVARLQAAISYVHKHGRHLARATELEYNI